MECGHIKWFKRDKGYGFITKADGTDVFIHFSGLAEGEDRLFLPGEQVFFDQVDGEKGPKAANARRSPPPEG